MHQHTGNWPGKTVSNATGNFKYNNKDFMIVDIPGTYSLMSDSEEEEIARNYICFGNPDATVVVVDATSLERNLNLLFQIMEITDNVILCVNLLDEAQKKKIDINLKLLSKELGIPVIGTIARKKKTLDTLKKEIYTLCSNSKKTFTNFEIKYDKIIESAINKIQTYLINKYSLSEKLSRWISIKLIDGEKTILNDIEKNFSINVFDDIFLNNILDSIKKDFNENNVQNNEIKDILISKIIKKSEEISKKVVNCENHDYSKKDIKIDKILTSKRLGFPIMFLFLGIIFWLTIVGANYPSEFLFSIFGWLQSKLLIFADYINCPSWLSDMLILGVYQTLTWIISVMLPPMAIFFPLFTFLEDLGYLPRIAFNMDGLFRKCCCSGKQMITMCMGFGCNSAGVVGCRIINSPRERLIAILTNNLVPCNR